MTWKGRQLSAALSDVLNVHGTNANDEAAEAEAQLIEVEERDARLAAREQQRQQDLASTYPSLRRR